MSQEKVFNIYRYKTDQVPHSYLKGNEGNIVGHKLINNLWRFLAWEDFAFSSVHVIIE